MKYTEEAYDMRQKILFLLAGMALGAALLSGGYAAANAVLTASPSGQTFYIDGQQTAMTAYLIGGSNYVRLRDIGRAVGFNVYWDGTVQIESDKPYTGVAPAAQPAPAAPTEESVLEVLENLEARYPNNTYWPSPYRSASGGPYHSGMNCAGWATLCSDAAFGNLPWRKVTAPVWSQLCVGDLVQFNTESANHVVVIVEKTDEYIIATESSTTQKAFWGAQYFRWWLEEQNGLVIYTRYPE